MKNFAIKLVRVALILVLAFFGLSGLVYVGFRLTLRTARASLRSHPDPVHDYAGAISRLQKIQASEGPELNPVCHSILLTHGMRTEKAIIFFHGYTNCPEQFRELGQLFYALGYNVLIPLLPRHGVADRKVGNLTPLKAEELRDCADTSVDIACGLGEKVMVAGLSAGGTLAAWIGQNRSEVNRVLLIAPALGLTRRAGTRVQKVMALLLPLIPDIQTDWVTEDPDAPTHTYTGFSSRALGQLLRLSAATFAEAVDRAPKVQDVALLTSKYDDAVSDFISWQLINLWRNKGLFRLAGVDFPKRMKIEHDMIDPTQKNQQTSIVYPILVRLLEAP
ncbi:MAG: alpha/beta fold hydrolase [Verrucomicrobia bacterium]|nr:alpha/beta fold hydrolase [Verrucomicrobiota bacterium]